MAKGKGRKGKKKKPEAAEGDPDSPTRFSNEVENPSSGGTQGNEVSGSRPSGPSWSQVTRAFRPGGKIHGQGTMASAQGAVRMVETTPESQLSTDFIDFVKE